MIKNRELDHIGMAVTDPAKAAAWYQDILGFKLTGKFPNNEGKDVYFVSNTSGGVTYEIYEGDNLPEACIGKIDHISYPSDDIEKDYAYALEQGYTICTDGIEGIPTFWDNGVRYFKILSASGEQVEFCQKV